VTDEPSVPPGHHLSKACGDDEQVTLVAGNKGRGVAGKWRTTSNLRHFIGSGAPIL